MVNMNTLLDYTALTNRQLVELHLDGDREAFRQIVERHQAMVCALGLSACGDVSRSEDIAQEVFVTAWKQLPGLREPEKLRGWLAGIARNLINNSFRRAARTPTARAESLSVDTPEETAGPRERAISADESALMWGALEGIPATYREPMILFYREQHSVAAVAGALEISEEAVRQRLARGRALLSERMATLVEETLERSAPTAAFAGMVMLSLPIGPLAIETALGAGGTAAKTLTTAGAIGTAAAKGGAVFKVLSVVAFLPALLQGVEDFIRFNDRNAAPTGTSTRRRAAKAYLTMNLGIGLFILAFLVLPNLMPHPTPPFVFPVIGLWVMGAIWLSVRAKCRMNRLMADRPALAEPHRGFERRSAGQFLGLPLYHVRLGTRPTRRAPAVTGWIAISDGWAVGGLFAFGPAALAPFAMGVLSGGAVSVGVAALGVGSLGIAAAGWWSAGLAAFGGFAAKGIIIFAPQFTSVASAHAVHAGDAAAKAFFQTHWFYRFTSVSAECLVWAGLLGWVMPVVLTGWQLWRTRAPR
jgi:RNA polymerase sigma factor (sigma-70 family)